MTLVHALLQCRGSQDLQPVTKSHQTKLQGDMELVDWLLLECFVSLSHWRRINLPFQRIYYC